jgi:hypothetical protein
MRIGTLLHSRLREGKARARVKIIVIVDHNRVFADQHNAITRRFMAR